MRIIRPRPDDLALLASDKFANVRLAVFVHGFKGSHLGTWGRLPELLAVNADRDATLRDWDFLFVGYDTARVSSFLDIAHIICTRVGHGMQGQLPMGRRYSRVALIGHSLGTLGIRQVLCAWSEQPAGLQAALHAVLLFGTPLNGSGLANKVSWLYPIASALEKGSPQLRMLRAWMKSANAHRPLPQARVILGLDDQVVGYQDQDMVDWPGDIRPVDTIGLDHGKLVKPDDWSQADIVDYLRSALG